MPEARRIVVLTLQEAGGLRTAGVEACDQSALVLTAYKDRTSVLGYQPSVLLHEGTVTGTGEEYCTADDAVLAIESVHGEAAVDVGAECEFFNVANRTDYADLMA